MTCGAEVVSQCAIDLVFEFVRGSCFHVGDDSAYFCFVVALQVLVREFEPARRGEGLDLDDEMVRSVGVEIVTAPVAAIANHTTAPEGFLFSFVSVVNVMSFSSVRVALPLSMATVAF